MIVDHKHVVRTTATSTYAYASTSDGECKLVGYTGDVVWNINVVPSMWSCTTLMDRVGRWAVVHRAREVTTRDNNALRSDGTLIKTSSSSSSSDGGTPSDSILTQGFAWKHWIKNIKHHRAATLSDKGSCAWKEGYFNVLHAFSRFVSL